MDESQFRRAKKLVRSLCANHDYGNCVLLDNGSEACVCPQLISYSLICKYFRNAVLPAERELHAEIMGTDTRRHCGDCLQPFMPKRKNTLYCKSCAARRTRKNKREWIRKYRGRM
ncbi:MAG: cysteine-rich VLP domain-containing protein [Clostridia bacterium]|nr:cysteine-rich VLP domain-containing protein [Clostridia bacterium]